MAGSYVGMAREVQSQIPRVGRRGASISEPDGRHLYRTPTGVPGLSGPWSYRRPGTNGIVRRLHSPAVWLNLSPKVAERLYSVRR
jgi:hypothetical protein